MRILTSVNYYAIYTVSINKGATMRINSIDWIAYALTIIGGLNWGLVGAFKFNLVTEIFGENSGLSRLIFVLVGLSAIYLLYTASKFLPSANTARSE